MTQEAARHRRTPLPARRVHPADVAAAPCPGTAAADTLFDAARASYGARWARELLSPAPAAGVVRAPDSDLPARRFAQLQLPDPDVRVGRWLARAGAPARPGTGPAAAVPTAALFLASLKRRRERRNRIPFDPWSPGSERCARIVDAERR